MLTESELKELANTLSGIYADVEDACIKGICKRLSDGLPISYSDSWRLRKLSEVKGLRSELIKAISDESKKSLVKVRSEIRKALVGAQFMDRKKVADLLDNPIKEFEKSEAFLRVQKAVERNARKSMNLTNTRALEASIKTYKDGINRSYLDVMTGTKTLDQAMRDACSDIGGTGIKVTYVSDSGRVTRTNLDVSIRRDIVTSVNQAGIESTLAFCEEYDIDLVETSWHNGARTAPNSANPWADHERWQGKVFSLNGKTAGYPSFVISCGWGEVDGIGGCNCRHSISPYIEGMPKATQEGKQTRTEDRKQYQAEQKQRYYERRIRSLKRERVALSSAGYDTKDVESRLRDTQEQIRKHVSLNKLTRDYRRESIGNGIATNKTSTSAPAIQQTKKEDARTMSNPRMYPPTLGGASIGKEMTFEEANKMRSNPKYYSADEYRVNCQTCVVAHEARMRGYNVSAMGNTKKADNLSYQLSHQTNLAWIDPKTGKHPDYFGNFSNGDRGWRNRIMFSPKKLYKFAEENLVDGGRYTIEFAWKGNRRSGHIIHIAKTDGKIWLYDPQVGKRVDGSIDVLAYFKEFKYKRTIMGIGQFAEAISFLRVDTCEFNIDFVNKILEASK